MPGEVVIYLLGSQSDSLIQQAGGAAYAILHDGGSTAPSLLGKTLSEVYVHNFSKFTGLKERAPAIAVSVFHEAMHNKLYPTDIHADGGGGVALSANFAWNPLTQKNKQLMAPALAKPVPQYLPLAR